MAKLFDGGRLGEHRDRQLFHHAAAASHSRCIGLYDSVISDSTHPHHIWCVQYNTNIHFLPIKWTCLIIFTRPSRDIYTARWSAVSYIYITRRVVRRILSKNISLRVTDRTLAPPFLYEKSATEPPPARVVVSERQADNINVSLTFGIISTACSDRAGVLCTLVVSRTTLRHLLLLDDNVPLTILHRSVHTVSNTHRNTNNWQETCRRRISQ